MSDRVWRNRWMSQLYRGQPSKTNAGTHQFVSGEEAGETQYFYPTDTVCKVCRAWLSSDGKIFRRGCYAPALLKCHLCVLLE
jgi:hypothetical protein